jgi:hypothetical protein
VVPVEPLVGWEQAKSFSAIRRVGNLNASAEVEWKKFFLASGIDPDRAQVLAVKVEAVAVGFTRRGSRRVTDDRLNDVSSLREGTNPLHNTAVGGRHEKSEPKRTTEQKIRKCLICRSPFPSAWAGERICRRCKNTSAWRSGAL